MGPPARSHQARQSDYNSTAGSPSRLSTKRRSAQPRDTTHSCRQTTEDCSPFGNPSPPPRSTSSSELTASAEPLRGASRTCAHAIPPTAKRSAGSSPVPEQLLHRANVVSALQQVRRERVPKRLACRPLGQSGPQHGIPDLALDHRLVQVMPPHLATARLDVGSRGREHPPPLAPRVDPPRTRAARAARPGRPRAATRRGPGCPCLRAAGSSSRRGRCPSRASAGTRAAAGPHRTAATRSPAVCPSTIRARARPPHA